MPIALALVAGGFATLNPCGFALLPALLSFYVGAEEEDLPRAPTRALQGVLVVKGAFIGLPPLSWDFARQPMNAAAPPDVSTPGGGAAHGVTLNPNLIL